MMRSGFGEDIGRAIQRDQCIVFELDNPPNTRTFDSDIFVVSQDGSLEIFDVMCSREDVEVRFTDMGNQREVQLTGPWLRRREVAIVEMLQIMQDVLEEGRAKNHPIRAIDVLTEVLSGHSGALVRPLVFPPNSAYRISIVPQTLEAWADPRILVWTKAVQWVNL